MNDYCDSSFLLSTYLIRSNSEQAAQSLMRMKQAIPVSTLALLELENALRLGSFLMTQGSSEGVPIQVAQSALAQLEIDFEAGRLKIVYPDYEDVFRHARRISHDRTWMGGYRSMDILHVATALALGSLRFLTFDLRQRELADLEGFNVAF